MAIVTLISAADDDAVAMERAAHLFTCTAARLELLARVDN
jgi:hypothetical protein